MAKMNQGILGPVSGTVGSVIGSSWKGIDYIRSKAVSVSQPNTQPQLEQRAKFKTVVRFVQTLTGLVAITFKNAAVKESGYNRAFSNIFRNALSGSYPAYDIDYPKVLLAQGDLPNGAAPKATAGSNSIINFAWQDNSGMGKAQATDRVVLAVYCPTFNQTLWEAFGPARSTLAATIDATLFSGEAVETWMAFTSVNGKEVSNSVWTGHLTVS